MSSDGTRWGASKRVRSEAQQLLLALSAQADLIDPVREIVERKRTALVVALMELADDPAYGTLRAGSVLVLDRLSEMLEDPALRLGW